MATKSFRSGRIGGAIPTAKPFVIAAFAISVLVGVIFIDPVFLHLARSAPSDVVRFFQLITDIGRSYWMLWPSILAIIALSVLFRSEAGRKLSAFYQHLIGILAYVVACLLLSSLVYHLLKGFVGRARPAFFDIYGPLYFQPFSFSSDFASFPSGHAATIFAFATAIALMWRAARAPLFTLAALVALSRIFVGKHYFSDVVAGSAIGVWAALAVRGWFAARGVVFVRRPNGRLEVQGRAVLRWLARSIRQSLAKRASPP